LWRAGWTKRWGGGFSRWGPHRPRALPFPAPALSPDHDDAAAAVLAPLEFNGDAGGAGVHLDPHDLGRRHGERVPVRSVHVERRAVDKVAGLAVAQEVRLPAGGGDPVALAHRDHLHAWNAADDVLKDDRVPLLDVVLGDEVAEAPFGPLQERRLLAPHLAAHLERLEPLHALAEDHLGAAPVTGLESHVLTAGLIAERGNLDDLGAAREPVEHEGSRRGGLGDGPAPPHVHPGIGNWVAVDVLHDALEP